MLFPHLFSLVGRNVTLSLKVLKDQNFKHVTLTSVWESPLEARFMRTRLLIVQETAAARVCVG